jgi:energy-coupling factor transport system permease protein
LVFGGGEAGHVLVPLPEVALPGAVAGIQLLGDVTAEALLGGLYDGLRLATMLICLGAANALANPRRLLRSMPPALHEVSTAVVVAMSVFPQLAESVVRVTRARRLRPSTPGESKLSAVLAVVIPVLEDSLDRSVLLAASMDSRGYGRSGGRSLRASRAAGSLLVCGLAGICVGAYGVLDATTPRYLAAPMLGAGVCVGAAGLVLSGRAVTRSAYRPDRWRAAELVTASAGIAAAVLLFLASGVDASDLNPSLSPLSWPQLPLLPLVGILIGLFPVVAAPQAAPLESGSR